MPAHQQQQRGRKKVARCASQAAPGIPGVAVAAAAAGPAAKVVTPVAALLSPPLRVLPYSSPNSASSSSIAGRQADGRVVGDAARSPWSADEAREMLLAAAWHFLLGKSKLPRVTFQVKKSTCYQQQQSHYVIESTTGASRQSMRYIWTHSRPDGLRPPSPRRVVSRVGGTGWPARPVGRIHKPKTVVMVLKSFHCHGVLPAPVAAGASCRKSIPLPPCPQVPPEAYTPVHRGLL